MDNWLYQQIVSAVLSGVADNSLTDVKLSDAVGQIKERFTAHQSLPSSETVSGHVELATAIETTTGTDNTRAVHPLGLKSATNLLIPLTQKGAINGVPSLDASGYVPISQLGNNAQPGSFTGDGTASRTISLPFTPKIVFLNVSGGYTAIITAYGTFINGAYISRTIVTNGFQIGTATPSTNISASAYSYVAI